MVIIRFGVPQVLPHEKPVLDAIGSNTRVGIIGAFGTIGYIGLFKTHMEANEIAQLFKEAAASKNDELPVIVTPLETMGYDLTPIGFDHLLQAYAEAEAQAKEMGFDGEQLTTKCNLTLDELLDKIAVVGSQNLTEKEKARLKELTNNLH